MKRLIYSIIILLAFYATALSQLSFQEQLFKEVDKVLKKANKEQAKLYSPENYKEAMTLYQEAKTNLNRGGNIQNIREDIAESQKYLEKAIEISNKANMTLATAIESRNAAKDADAEVYAKDLWESAEIAFKRAMQNLENDDESDAKSYAGDAETDYRKAELLSIKINLIGPARQLLEKAENMDAEDYAAISFKKAQVSIEKMESLINNNRYAREEGLALAKDAKYQAQHAIFMTQTVRKLEKQDYGFEEILLLNEQNLSEIAEVMEINADFNSGYAKTREDIIAKIQALQESNEKAQQDVISLEDRISMMEIQVSEYSEIKEALQKKIALEDEQKRKIKMISDNFTKEEAQVFRDRDNMIIRLYGLSFQSGKSEIRATYFGLLSKVQKGIKEFDNCEVIIEGHTDSWGGADLNQRLSEERAIAVQEYLLANMKFPREKMSFIGYGEVKPVANNETKMGREKNRRIDLVIIPEWAKKK